MFAEAAEIATAIGDKRHILFAFAGLGRVAYREERWEVAGTHARESLRLAQELGMKLPAVEASLGLGGIAAATGERRGLPARSRRRSPPLASRTRRSRICDYQEVIERVKAAATRKPGSEPRPRAGQ